MNPKYELQPIQNTLSPVPERLFGEHVQKNNHPPFISKYRAKTSRVGSDLKTVVRYVTIPIPREVKTEQEKVKVPDNKKEGQKCLNPHLNQLKVRLKPPRNNDSEFSIITTDLDLLEEMEVSSEETPMKSDNNISEENHDTNQNSNCALVDKTRFVDQETQTDIYSCLYRNEKLYTIISDGDMMYVSNVVPVLQTQRKSLPNFNHNVNRKVPCNKLKNDNSKQAVTNKTLPGTNNIVEQISIPDDSMSGDDSEEGKTVETTKLTSLNRSELSYHESVTQSNDLPSHNSYSDVTSTEKSCGLQNQNNPYIDLYQHINSQENLKTSMNEVHDVPLCRSENEETSFNPIPTSLEAQDIPSIYDDGSHSSTDNRGSNSIIDNSFNPIPTSLETQNIPNICDGGFHSRTGNKTKPTPMNASALVRKLCLELNNCLVEDKLGNIPLQQAVLDDDTTKIKSQCIVLRSMKYNLNHVNLKHETALMIAVKMMSHSENRPSCETVKLLLDEGVDQTITDMEGYVPLHYAVKTGSIELTRLLLDANQGEKVLNKYGNDGLVPLHLAAIENHADIINQLVYKGCDINAQDRKSGRTPFFFAVENRNLEAARTLLNLKANTSIQNFAGHSPTTKQLSDLKNVALKKPSVTPAKTLYYANIDENCFESDVDVYCTGNIPKHKISVPEKTCSLGYNQSITTQAVRDSANDSFSKKFQNIDPSTRYIVHGNIIIDMFPNVRSHSSIKSKKNLKKHSSPHIPDNKLQRLQYKPDHRNTHDKNSNCSPLEHNFLFENSVVNNSFDGMRLENESPVVHNKVESRDSRVERTNAENDHVFPSRSDLDINGSVVTDDGCGDKAASYTIHAMDNGNVLGTLAESTVNNECYETGNNCSVKDTGCTIVAIDYGNAFETLPDDMVNNEYRITDDNSSAKATSYTSFALDGGNSYGTHSCSEIGEDTAIYRSVKPSAVSVGNYELSINSPCQEVISDVPCDLQLGWSDVHKDSSLKQGSNERTHITSKSKHTNKERKPKRKGTDIKSQNRTKKLKNE